MLDVEVAIVGAGPTGLLLAGDLARAGVSCMLLERRADRSGQTPRLTRAFAVQPRTLEELDARGMADDLIATGAGVSGLRFLGGTALDLSGLPTRFPYVLVTPQYETERVLEERARRLGADLRYGHEVTGLAQQPDGVDVEVQQEGQPTRTVRAGYVVGTDGMHSTVRGALRIPFPGKPVLRSVMLADVRLAEPPPDVLTVNTTGGAFALIAPFGDGWYRVIAWHRANQPPESAPVTLAEVRDATRQALGTDHGMHDPRWLSRFHSEERQVPRYGQGRVLLAGDAAHVNSPAGGQGMNTGLQDAANLGWKLAATVQGWAPQGLLNSYHRERHPVGRQALRTSGMLVRVGLAGGPSLVAVSKLLTPAAVQVPFIAQRLAGVISGLSISYPRLRGAHPLAGRRVPDWPLADGRRLYEALRPGRLVLASNGVLAIEATMGYSDRVDSVAIEGVPEVGPPGDGRGPQAIIALIRPDAYVGWATPWATGQPAVPGALARWSGSPRTVV